MEDADGSADGAEEGACVCEIGVPLGVADGTAVFAGASVGAGVFQPLFKKGSNELCCPQQTRSPAVVMAHTWAPPALMLWNRPVVGAPLTCPVSKPLGALPPSNSSGSTFEPQQTTERSLARMAHAK